MMVLIGSNHCEVDSLNITPINLTVLDRTTVLVGIYLFKVRGLVRPTGEVCKCAGIFDTVTAATYKLYQQAWLDSTRECKALLDLGNRKRWVETLWTGTAAVENGVASVQAHAVIEVLLALLGLLVTRVGDPSVGLHEHGWAKVLLAVPPVGWAGCAAARAENALVHAVKLASISLRLAVLTSLVMSVFVHGLMMDTHIWRWCCPLKVWLNRLVLLVELCHIWHEILDDICVWKWVDASLLASISWNTACFLSDRSSYILLAILTETSQCVHTINVHGTATADTLSAASSECECWVHLVLDPDQSVQHHRSSLVQVECVALHLWLACWLIWVPPVDVESLDERLLGWCSLGLRRCLGSRLGCTRRRWCAFDSRSHASASDLRCWRKRQASWSKSQRHCDGVAMDS